MLLDGTSTNEVDPSLATAAASTHARAEDVDSQPGRVVIIDDEEEVTRALRSALTTIGYSNVEGFNDPNDALNVIFSPDPPDVLVMDVQMPNINGLELLKRVRSEYDISDMPVVILTACEDQRLRDIALQAGANDFLNKPISVVNLSEINARIRNLIIQKHQHTRLLQLSRQLRQEVLLRTKELYATRREAIHCLARAGDSRDTETGEHVVRVGRYAAIISAQLGMNDDFVSWIELAAQLHDVGKFSVPESILRKPGKLTPEERRIMEGHCDAASSIFYGSSLDQGQITSPLLQMAARIAVSHHEWWDGSGYPAGLARDTIPIEGRITAVADVFDALSTRRPYKDAIDMERCFKLLGKGRGAQFDPRVIDAFFAAKYDILGVFYERAC